MRPPTRVRRANAPRLMRARRQRERSEGSHSRAACARISVSPSSPCGQSSARPSVRLSPRAPQRPRAARAGRPRCTRERLAPLAQPLERLRRDGWLSPPRRDRSRGRRARCPARESRACGRTERSWRARRVTPPSASSFGAPARRCLRVLPSSRPRGRSSARRMRPRFAALLQCCGARPAARPVARATVLRQRELQANWPQRARIGTRCSRGIHRAA